MEKRRSGEGCRPAYRLRRSGPESIVFIHGLGAGKNSFETCFGLSSFDNYTLAALDLPGCGETPFLDGFSYTVKDQAGVVQNWIMGLRLDPVILVGHSMGGVISLHLAESIGSRVKAFFNLEGNLTPEDCFFLSGKIASLSQEVFEERGFQQFKRTLRDTMKSDPSPGIKNYYENISKASPRALYLSARSLVKVSYEGELSTKFLNLPTKKWYVFGERSVNLSTKTLLDRNHIPYFIVPQSGHFMMDDQPELFYGMLLEALTNG